MMEWNIRLPEVPIGEAVWQKSVVGTTDFFFLHFSATIIMEDCNKYAFSASMNRKSWVLNSRMNWDSFEFSFSNAKFHKRPKFPAELFGVDIIRNTTPNGYYGDLIIFNMILPSKNRIPKLQFEAGSRLLNILGLNF